MGEERDHRLDQILDVVTAGSRVLVRIAAQSLDRAGVDITLSQCRALVTVTQLGPLGLVDLAGALSVHPSTATRMCDRLVAKGLILRERVDGGVSLRPTAAGLAIVDTITRERRRQLRRIVSQLSDEEQQELVRCMDAFRRAGREPGEGEWAFGWWE